MEKLSQAATAILYLFMEKRNQTLNPLSHNVRIQILQADIRTFP